MSRRRKLEMPNVRDFQDEFENTLERARQDPEFRAAYEDAQERHSILDKLVSLRRTLNLSQSTVAARMGVTQPTVSGFETEDSDPRLSSLQRYSRAVGARIRLVLTVPRECDWIRGEVVYCRSRPLGSAETAAVHEGGLAEIWWAEKQRPRGPWSVSA
jgi:transcriptional regulator with XRE-family HTH domain